MSTENRCDESCAFYTDSEDPYCPNQAKKEGEECKRWSKMFNTGWDNTDPKRHLDSLVVACVFALFLLPLSAVAGPTGEKVPYVVYENCFAWFVWDTAVNQYGVPRQFDGNAVENYRQQQKINRALRRAKAKSVGPEGKTYYLLPIADGSHNQMPAWESKYYDPKLGGWQISGDKIVNPSQPESWARYYCWDERKR